MKIVISLFVLIILTLSLGINIDEHAMKLQDEAFDRAMIAFGLAKGLNAIVSLIQGTELSFAPAGVGLNFSVGQVLDPFNDLVERFSWIMLFASVSLGIQKLILILSAKTFLQVSLFLCAGLVFVLLWIKKIQNSKVLLLSMKLFTLLLILRFGAIFFIYSSEIFYASTLQNQYEKSSEIIEVTKNKLEELHGKNKILVKDKKAKSFFQNLNNKYENALKSLNISNQIESLKMSLDKASRNIINIITVFIVGSVIMPLLFLMLLIYCVKVIFRLDGHNFITNSVYTP